MVFLDCLLVVVVIFVRSLFSSEYLIFSTQTYPVKLGECVFCEQNVAVLLVVSKSIEDWM